jgi:hypothetical protein
MTITGRVKSWRKQFCFGAQSNSVAYGYTPRGALASQKQGTILTEYRYDERNNLQQDKVQYSYDALGNVTNILRNDGRSVSLEWERGDSRETLNDFEKAVKLWAIQLNRCGIPKYPLRVLSVNHTWDGFLLIPQKRAPDTS